MRFDACDRLETLSAEHSFEKGFAESLAAPGGRERLKDMLEANPPVQHPVLRTHPESGKTSLFVNRLFTSHIIGIEKAESDALLADLCEFSQQRTTYPWPDTDVATLWYSDVVADAHMEQPRFRCRFQWTEGAIVFWDNRITQHRPVNDYWPQHRKLQRITVDDGDRPTYAPNHR